MQNLIDEVELLKNSEISEVVTNRINEFKKIKKGSSDELFKELCYCILTAGFSAEKCIKTHKEIGDGFLTYSEEELAKKLKKLGYRFPNRAKYIPKALESKEQLKKNIQSFKGDDLRKFIVNDIDGIGYKEASHFLRNIGFDDFAIIDYHIVDTLTKYNLIEKPKTMTRKKYLEIEKVLKQIAQKSNLTLAELDLYLWYMETSKILK